MKSTPRVIQSYCPTLHDTLVGVGEMGTVEELRPASFYISTVEKDGKTEGTLLFFRGLTPPDLIARFRR